MKTLKEYIAESFEKKKYVFKLKIAGDITEDQEKSIKSLLEKYGVDNFTKQASTPIQGLPLDFPTLKNLNVNMFDITLNYPTTPQELHEYLCAGARISSGHLVIRNPNEPSEGYQTETESKRKGSLLDDPNYKELPKIKTDDYYGTKYNLSLLKELSKDSKERAKARGEKVPSESKKSSPEYEGKGSTSPISGKK